MTLCRCKNHQPKNNRKHIYVEPLEPLGYPKTSSICGRDCETPGLIWVTKEELIRYHNGQRIFTYSSNVTKVKLK